MATNLSVISGNDSFSEDQRIIDIANQILDGTWNNVQKDVDLTQFTNKCIVHGTYTINTHKSWQVRDESVNYAFVERQVAKISKNGDYSELKKPVILYFPEKYNYEGIEFPRNSFAILDDTHGILIKVNVGLFKYDAYIVNFQTDLDSREDSVRRLGNLLNVRVSEHQSTQKSDVKREYHSRMDYRISLGLDANPTPEEDEKFLECYPFLTARTLGQFRSSHSEEGNRSKKSLMVWTPELREDELKRICKLPKYEDNGYVIVPPRTVQAWNEEALAYGLKKAYEEKLKRVLIILYASTKKQADGIDNDEGSYSKTRIEKYYEGMAEYYGLESIEAKFLNTK